MKKMIGSILTLVLGLNLVQAGSYTTQIESILVKGSEGGDPNVIQVNLVTPNWIHPVIRTTDLSKNQLLSTLLTAKSTGATVTINTLDNNANYPTITEIQF
jgi:hypothetical protein